MKIIEWETKKTRRDESRRMKTSCLSSVVEIVVWLGDELVKLVELIESIWFVVDEGISFGLVVLSNWSSFDVERVEHIFSLVWSWSTDWNNPIWSFEQTRKRKFSLKIEEKRRERLDIFDE